MHALYITNHSNANYVYTATLFVHDHVIRVLNIHFYEMFYLKTLSPLKTQGIQWQVSYKLLSKMQEYSDAQDLNHQSIIIRFV